MGRCNGSDHSATIGCREERSLALSADVSISVWKVTGLDSVPLCFQKVLAAELLRYRAGWFRIVHRIDPDNKQLGN